MPSQTERIIRVPDSVRELPEGTAASTQEEGGVQLWLDRYLAQLPKGGMSSTACDVIRSDALYITQKCILGAGRPGSSESSWPAERLRRGLVVGSVQSGKTSSMLSVTAACLDEQVDVVVILTGTRTALWRQTAERTLEQLDCWSPEKNSALRRQRMLIPKPELIQRVQCGVELKHLYYENPSLLCRKLTKGLPLIAIVMKQGDHLMKFAAQMRDVLDRTLSSLDRPMHLLVIDDESDDGSVLDAVVERGLGSDSEQLKQIPRHIAQIWGGSGPNHTTFNNRLFATYIGYTATPQANVLQADHNPLAPKDFIVALRTPLDSGGVGPPRCSTFEEPLGLRNYYTGGELFYKRLFENDGRVIEPTPFPDREGYATEQDFRVEVDTQRNGMLSDALRAYFVAAASSLWVSGKKVSVVRATEPTNYDQIHELTPKPISMLAHPSSQQEEHFQMAEKIAAWSLGLDLSSFNSGDLPRDEHGIPKLSVDGLVAQLSEKEDEWKQWLGSYEATRGRLRFWPGGDGLKTAPLANWDEVKRLLVEEVFPYVRLAVINSDRQADDRPQFEPCLVEGDHYTAPVDIFTIFVSGNVMARGITIEGLVTTLFLRSANQPAADTQMQMQRWFGYRGAYLHWCRVFLFEDQLTLFRQYHEADESMRAEIIEEMNRNTSGVASPLVLQGADFRATGKIMNLRTLPLCPGSAPFVKVVDHTATAVTNNGVLARLLDDNSWQDVIVGDAVHGRAMESQLSLVQVAELLEEFRYPHHDPDPALPQNVRWHSLARTLRLDSPLFRVPAVKDVQAVTPPYCPYSIAAYLRLWDAVLTRKAPGLFPTDDRTTPWSMVNLSDYRDSAPRFYVGVRYGSGGLSSDPALAEHGIISMIRKNSDGVIESAWGSRNSEISDQLFDYYVHGDTPPPSIPGEPRWRPRGAPGLLLFHVVKSGNIPAGNDGVTVGLALPLGGPDQFAALRPPLVT